MIYIKIIASILVVGLLIGWVLPYLISAKSNELPLLGIAIIVSVPILLYLIFKPKKS